MSKENEHIWKVYCHTNKINGKKYIGITSRTLNQDGKMEKDIREILFLVEQ